MAKRKRTYSAGVTIGLVATGLVGLAVIIVVLTTGKNVALLQPKGLIAEEQLRLLKTSVLLLLEIAIPTLAIFYYFAWKYRESNSRAEYSPDVRHGKMFVPYLWLIPSVTALLMAVVLWPATHKLEPQKPISSDMKPLTVQVVAMRWKWLFIYPEQNIATVNYVQVPVGQPVQFELSADEAPMSSFWIPNLGGQLYAMTGHVNRLNLMAAEAGDYPGSSAEINGAGFAGMKFVARASTPAEFNSWVQDVKQSPDVLTAVEYRELLTPSENSSVAFYSQADPNLYGTMLVKYSGSHGHPAEYP